MTITDIPLTYTKDDLIAALEARRKKAEKVDAKNLAAHRKDEAKYLAGFKKACREAHGDRWEIHAEFYRRRERAIMRRVLEQFADDAVARADDHKRKLDDVIAALTPSAETKRVYIGEFKTAVPYWDEEGELERTREHMIEWTTIKEIMKAIRAQARLTEGESA